MYQWIYIYLADNEWDRFDGQSNIMYDVAREALANGATVVEVHEHAGWYLTFAIVNGVMQIIGTANDLATFSPDIIDYWKTLRAIPREEWQYFAIYRSNTPA